MDSDSGQRGPQLPPYGELPALFAQLPALRAEVERRAWHVCDQLLDCLAAAAANLEAAYRIAIDMQLGADSLDNTVTSHQFQVVQIQLLAAVEAIAEAYRAQLE